MTDWPGGVPAAATPAEKTNRRINWVALLRGYRSSFIEVFPARISLLELSGTVTSKCLGNGETCIWEAQVAEGEGFEPSNPV